MPLYEYQCPKCGLTEEQLVLHGDNEIFFCSRCSQPKFDVVMTRMVSKTNFQLKGGCWAKDGYKSKGIKNQS